MKVKNCRCQSWDIEEDHEVKLNDWYTIFYVLADKYLLCDMSTEYGALEIFYCPLCGCELKKNTRVI